jgi:N-acetylmuramoyl-L-alanine amidase
LNRYSIGIELDNAGKMTKSGQAFVSWFGRKYDADQVIEAVHRNESSPSYWHTYSEEQLTSCFDLCRCLTRTYPIKTIVGHEEIAPGRKIDPGPAFPLERLREQILIGRSRDIAEEVEQPETPDTSTKAVVNTQLLNIRELPYSGSNLAGSPLPKGTIVEILERSDKWCKVKTVTQGWVHGDFLRVEG